MMVVPIRVERELRRSSGGCGSGNGDLEWYFWLCGIGLKVKGDCVFELCLISVARQ